MANDYDKIIRENIEAIILPLANRLFQLEIKSMEEVPDELQVTVERKPDFLEAVLVSFFGLQTRLLGCNFVTFSARSSSYDLQKRLVSLQNPLFSLSN
jgi:hypothetical protein